MTNKYFGFIYVTTNNINNKKYIGMRRYTRGWKTYLGSGVVLKKAIEKYGRDNFSREIIYNAATEDELKEKEKYYIDKFNCVNDDSWYNIAKGGRGGRVIDVYPTGKNHHAYGRKHSKETREKLSKANKGKKRTDEFCKYMSYINKGKKLSRQHKEKLSKAIKGRKLSKEHREKIGLSGKITKSKIRKQLEVEHECKVCGKIMKSVPSKVRVTCSKDCEKIIRHEKSAGSNNAMYGKPISDKCREIISNKIKVEMNNGDLLIFDSQKEASEYFNVGMSTVSRWKKNGSLKTMKEKDIKNVSEVE